MARAPSTFRQQDVTRALRAALRAGVEIQRCEIAPDGKIILVTRNDAIAGSSEPMSPLDSWRASRGAS
jgi:hypothetical protein